MADEALIQAITEALLASNHAGWRRMVAGYKNADGSITMSGAGVGKVWARPPEDSRGGTAVWGSAAYANAPLIVGPGFDGDYEVKGADWLTASISFGEGSRVIDQPPGMGELVPDSIPAKALKIGRVELSPNGGLNFRVSKHAYTGGYWTSEADQDASAEEPGTANEVCWVGAYHLPSANTVGVVSTTPVFGEPQDLDESDLADLVYPAGAVPLGPAFTLKNGQTELSASRFADLDPRIFLGAWDGVGIVQSIVAGTNVTVDDTDPANPIVSASGGGGGAYDYILIREEQSQNTAAGTFTSGSWQTRVLNTEVSDAGGHASISSNQITLAAGTYDVHIRCPAYKVNQHQARLQNISDTTTTLIGSCEFNYNLANAVQTSSVIIGRFTIATSKVFEVQHQATTTAATNGLGVPSNFTTEIYTVAEFRKVA